MKYCRFIGVMRGLRVMQVVTGLSVAHAVGVRGLSD